MYSNIKAIVFDSGNVLTEPASGNWFLPEKYRHFISKYGIKEKEVSLSFRLRKARRYLDRHHIVRTEEEEFEQFKEFYRIVFKGRRYAACREELIESMAYDTTYEDSKFRFFDDVNPCLDALGIQYVLGLISDTWPSLERVFRNRNLLRHFKCFIMSSVFGTTKQKPTLFLIALERLEMRAENVLFIDDAERNLETARKLGFQVMKMDRNGKSGGVENGTMVINSLYEIERFISQGKPTSP